MGATLKMPLMVKMNTTVPVSLPCTTLYFSDSIKLCFDIGGAQGRSDFQQSQCKELVSTEEGSQPEM